MRKPIRILEMLLVVAGTLPVFLAGCSHVPKVPDETVQTDPVAAARALTKSGKAGEALEKFTSILTDNPGNLAAHRGLVEAAHFSGRIAVATERYRTLIAKEPGNGLGYYGMGLVEVALGPGHMDGALQQFAEAEKRMPGEADIPYRIGLVYSLNGEYPKAVEVISRALKLDEQRPALRVALGNALAQIGKEQEAIEVMRPILRQSPTPEDIARARTITGKVFDPTRHLAPEVAQDVKKALDFLGIDAVQQTLSLTEDLVNRYPDLPIVHALRGLAHSRMENNGEAIVAFDRALQLDPRSTLTLVALGDIYLRTEKWQKARECFEQAIGLDPFDLEAHQRLAELADSRQDGERAERAFATVVQLDPTRTDSRLRWAMALVKTSRYPEAVAAFEDILVLDPQNLEAMIRLGELHVGLAQREPATRDIHREKAREALEKAHTLAPDNQAVKDMLDKLKE